MSECKVHIWKCTNKSWAVVNCINCGVDPLGEYQKLEKENADLSAKIGQLETQVAVMRGALEESIQGDYITPELKELYKDLLAEGGE